MKSYTIHEMPNPPAERIDRAEALTFVKDGFSIFAFIAPPIWMIANRLWIVLFGYLVVYALFELCVSLFSLPPTLRAPMILGLNLIIGFEADSLRRWTLERRDWMLVGTVTGENEAVCQRRFFEQWVPRTPSVASENLGHDDTADPFRRVATEKQSSNLGPVGEPKRNRGLRGPWSTRTS